jgi:hypothetical protein
MAKVKCHCGVDGHALSSINCPRHGRKHAANFRAWALGTQMRNGFHVRRIVWGKLMAQMEKRAGEEIRHAELLVGRVHSR